MEHHPSPASISTRAANFALRNVVRSSSRWLRVLCVSFAGLLLGAFVACAQDSGAVSGTVVNSYDGTPLVGATVTARGTTLATQTDSAGRFELKGVPLGDQVLRFSKSGFAAAVVTDVRV